MIVVRMESLAENLTLVIFPYHLILFLFVLVVIFKTMSAVQVWEECSLAVCPACINHFGIVSLATLGTMCHFSLGVG